MPLTSKYLHDGTCFFRDRIARHFMSFGNQFLRIASHHEVNSFPFRGLTNLKRFFMTELCQPPDIPSSFRDSRAKTNQTARKSFSEIEYFKFMVGPIGI